MINHSTYSFYLFWNFVKITFYLNVTMSRGSIDEDAINLARSAVEYDNKKDYELAISYYIVNDLKINI